MDEQSDVDEQQVECADIDAGGGSQCFEFGSDWVSYLAEADLPDNVTGVDHGIQDFEGQGFANV